MEIFNSVLLIVASGVLSYESVYSVAAYYVKRFLYLDREYPVIKAMCSPKALYKFFGLWMVVLLPLVPVAILHRFVFNLIQCNYCVSFWIGTASAIYFGHPLPMAICFGLVSMFASGLYHLIRKNGI